ncbi:flagellar motor switch protein FliN [Endozoicomonas sp. Mp262]|uniref:flagellar motor switch protein FliN n=1 Tax=Endozoicomonas sp. Mp262 TaxID=2919499 RepID=UPI0021DB2CA9
MSEEEQNTNNEDVATEAADSNETPATGEGAGGDDQSPDLGLILDIPVTLSLELGSTKISIGELLRLNKGSIVELEKDASDPLDVKVNGTLIAYAEVVVVDDRYGIRLLDVVHKSEWIKNVS